MRENTIILCRFCNTPLKHTFANLGMSPLANLYIKKEDLTKKENFYPLHVYVCGNCFLVQLPEFETAENIFSDYAYFSSYTDSWVEHARNYVENVIPRFSLDAKSLVIEIASNDGYLLQFFKQNNIPILGIEPAGNVAAVAILKGIPTLKKFFGKILARNLNKRNKLADLVIANNVLAHVPDLNDFMAGLKLILKRNGVITLEFPHLLALISKNEFDTIYHEHFSYFSLLAVDKVLTAHGLFIFDVEELTTHGGSLRIYAQNSDSKRFSRTFRFEKVLQKEIKTGLGKLSTYLEFNQKVNRIKLDTLKFLIDAKRKGKTIAGYGAPAKGNTFLNYCSIGTDFIDYTVDINPHKQNHFLPGSHIPIVSESNVFKTKPDYLFILP